MSPRTSEIALFTLCGAIAVFMIALGGDWSIRKFKAWREDRDMRVRDEKLKRYSMAAFKGSKNKW